MNGQISHIDITQNSVRRVYVKFSHPQAGLKAMNASYLSRERSWVSIEKSETRFPVKKSSTSPSINRT